MLPTQVFPIVPENHPHDYRNHAITGETSKDIGDISNVLINEITLEYSMQLEKCTSICQFIFSGCSYPHQIWPRTSSSSEIHYKRYLESSAISRFEYVPETPDDSLLSEVSCTISDVVTRISPL